MFLDLDYCIWVCFWAHTGDYSAGMKVCVGLYKMQLIVQLVII